MIDVVPLSPGRWLARCECDATAEFAEAATGWEWVLSHPCGAPEQSTVDLTDKARCTSD